jgi:hypothetical protein
MVQRLGCRGYSNQREIHLFQVSLFYLLFKYCLKNHCFRRISFNERFPRVVDEKEGIIDLEDGFTLRDFIGRRVDIIDEMENAMVLCQEKDKFNLVYGW